MALSITSETRGSGVYQVNLEGSLDTNTFNMLEEKVNEILTMTPKVLILDFQTLDYISSMGVRAVLKARKGIKLQGGRIFLVNLQPQIKKVFEIINALPSQRIFTSLEELDNYLDQMQKNVSE